MPARINIDALSDQIFSGHVNHIAPLPDPSSFWMNPDLKVYKTEIYIDNVANDLRNGMTCEVEIIAEAHTNALYIPLQSVVKIENRATAFVVVKHGKTEKRTIKTGSDNNRMIHIISGLEEGEKVLLAPPLTNSERNGQPLEELRPTTEGRKNAGRKGRKEHSKTVVTQ